MKWLLFKDALYNIEKYSKIELYYDQKNTPCVALYLGEYLEVLRGTDIGITYQNKEEAEEAAKNAKLEFYL